MDNKYGYYFSYLRCFYLLLLFLVLLSGGFEAGGRGCEALDSGGYNNKYGYCCKISPLQPLMLDVAESVLLDNN